MEKKDSTVFMSVDHMSVDWGLTAQEVESLVVSGSELTPLH